MDDLGSQYGCLIRGLLWMSVLSAVTLAVLVSLILAGVL